MKNSAFYKTKGENSALGKQRKGVRGAPRKRSPDLTRQKLLIAAFEEIHRHGFQAARLDAILAHAGVTKGALYHHFPHKTAFGYAVIEEVIQQRIFHRWLEALEGIADPIMHLMKKLQYEADTQWPVEALEVGCPLNNLANEMSPIDEGFRRRINAVFQMWREGLAQALRRGQERGHVRSDIDPGQVGAFLVAAVEGTIGLAKNAQSPALLRANFAILQDYLATLRPDRKRKKSAQGT